MMTETLRIGTRGSQLALWQAHYIKDCIQKHFPDQPVEIEIIKTKGDRITDRPLAQVGGKGLFVKEIETRLLDGNIDIAVHSMKDMPADLPEGLMIGAVPLREDPLDVMICSDQKEQLSQYPEGAVIGTSSLRRASQIKHLRPDVQVVSIRGNLTTRLAKLDAGQYHAIILAAAGIKRLNQEDRISQYLEPELMLPAVGQGALCVEVRKRNDKNIHTIMKELDHEPSRICVTGERAFLRKIEGSCHIPVACHAKIMEPGQVHITGLVASLDGQKLIKQTITTSEEHVENAGAILAADLLAQGGKAILEEINAPAQ